MAAPAPYDFTLYRGDDFDELTFYIRDPEGRVETLEPGTTARAHMRDRDGNLAAQFTVDVVGNRVRVRMRGMDTQQLAIGTYRYDVELTGPDGWSRRTPLAGKVKVVEDVTR